MVSFDLFGLKDCICNAVFSLCTSRGEVAFHTSVASPSFADEEEALNSIMKDLAALGKCGGLLDNNRNKSSIHSSKQVRCCLSAPHTPVDQRWTWRLPCCGELSLNVSTEVNKCCRSSARQNDRNFVEAQALGPLAEELRRYRHPCIPEE